MSVIIFIIILAVLVFAHELGHFSVAKLFKIRVDEFGFGFPPRIWATKSGETEYSINAIPFGGFVKIFGEDGSEENADNQNQAVQKENSFGSKNRVIQSVVLLAGVTANFLLAWILISIGFMTGLPAPVDSDMGKVNGAKLTITQILPDSPAEKAGLKSGDALISLKSGKEILENPSAEQTQEFIAKTASNLEIKYQRGKTEDFANVFPKEGIVDGRRAIGIGMDMIGTLKLPIHEALYVGAITTGNLTYATIVGLGDFVYKALTGKASIKEVSGPVGIAGLVGDATHLGFAYLLSIAAFISLNLAVINLVPFPALDGGRVFFVIVEAIKRSPINPKITQAVNGIGFILLIMLMIVVTYNDIIKLI
jgi:regulator of sigma E protease